MSWIAVIMFILSSNYCYKYILELLYIYNQLYLYLYIHNFPPYLCYDNLFDYLIVNIQTRVNIPRSTTIITKIDK